SPGAEPFVSPGDKVSEGSTLCMLEVMKLYSEIKAELAGTVARIDALDGQLVEHDQVLMWIEPA
ncbi:MAG: acetyl-CoA carboxylase biotin carboxyl carrier protein, partial [Mycobacteriales bacterium]